MQNYQIIYPSPLLSPYVKQYWFLKTGEIPGGEQRICPSGSSSLFFHRGSRMFSESAGTLQPTAFLAGQTTSYADLLQTGYIDMISIIFQPHGLKAFFSIPGEDLQNLIVSLHELKDPEMTRLQDQLYEQSDNYEAVKLIESFLLKKLAILKEYNYKRMEAVIRSINTGVSNVNSLANISCLSYKQFKRVFSEHVGLNPKLFLKVVRFQRFLYLRGIYPDHTFTRIALECGYYDQSHLNHDFILFTGYTPGECLAICSPVSDYFS